MDWIIAITIWIFWTVFIFWMIWHDIWSKTMVWRHVTEYFQASGSDCVCYYGDAAAQDLFLSNSSVTLSPGQQYKISYSIGTIRKIWLKNWLKNTKLVKIRVG